MNTRTYNDPFKPLPTYEYEILTRRSSSQPYTRRAASPIVSMEYGNPKNILEHAVSLGYKFTHGEMVLVRDTKTGEAWSLTVHAPRVEFRIV